MAILYACDATGKAVKDKADLVQVGVRGRLYCEDAAPHMEAYVKEVDELHDKCAAEFMAGLETIRSEYRGRLSENGKLPDE